MIDVTEALATWEEKLADPVLVAQVVSVVLHGRDYTLLPAEIRAAHEVRRTMKEREQRT